MFLILACAGLVVTAIPGVNRPLGTSPIAFLLLLAVELALLRVTWSTRPRIAALARLAMCGVPLVLAMAFRSYVALGTPDILEWDETYYLSIAVTGAGGRGLYPYVFGYGPMPIMGGLGYAAYAYALAVKIAGPTIFALRLVSLIVSIGALVCLWFLVRMLYGSASAWMATALTSTLRLFEISNTVRMDSLTFAAVTAGLLVAAIAFQRGRSKRWHLLAGLVFGLGLQAHIDTFITAAGCGLLYLLTWVRDMRANGRPHWPTEMLLYSAGWCAGLAVFVLFNVLPDPEAFYRTTVRIRVDATGWYSGGTSSLLGSFLDPHILAAKASALYGVLYRQLHRVEIGLLLASIGATVARRANVDKAVLTVAAGVLLAATVVLNNASSLYFIHVVPALVLPIGALFTHGIRRQGMVRLREVGSASLLAFAIAVSALFAVNTAKSWQRTVLAAAQTAADAAFVARVRSTVDAGCVVAGDGRLYVKYFADYPFFISARPTEVSYAKLFYGLDDDATYWDTKSPEAVAWPGELPAGLTAFVARRRLPARSDGIWTSDRCARSAGR